MNLFKIALLGLGVNILSSIAIDLRVAPADAVAPDTSQDQSVVTITLVRWPFT